MKIAVKKIGRAWLSENGRVVLPLEINGVRYDWQVPPECDTTQKAKDFLRLKIERAESGPLAEAKSPAPAPPNPLGVETLTLET